MVATVVFTQNSIVNLNKGNNQLAYQFPNSVSFPNHEIAVQNISMYYSWVNINSTTLKNNIFYYIWNVGSVSTPVPVTLPDGLYEISTINKYLQFTMIANGHYAKDNTNAVNVYFAEFIVNTQSYGVQINCFPIPSAFLVGASTTFTSGSVSYTTPSNWVNPGTIFTPTVTMCNPVTLAYTNFYKTVGFPALWSSFNTNGGSPYTYTVNSSTTATSQNSTTAL